jgi:hypothetical protein
MLNNIVFFLMMHKLKYQEQKANDAYSGLFCGAECGGYLVTAHI